MSDLAYIEEAAPRWPRWKSGDGGGSERREIEERMSKRYARELVSRLVFETWRLFWVVGISSPA